MKQFLLILLVFFSLGAKTQPRLNIPYTGLSFTTDTVTPSVTVVNANMYVENLDLFFSFSDSLYINAGVLDTLGQVQLMSIANEGLQSIATNDSVYLTGVTISINHSMFQDGNNTVVIWPAAPNSFTNDSIYLPFYYDAIIELESSDIAVFIGPNPATEFITVFDPQNLVKQVRIYNCNGDLVLNERQKFISVAYLPSGIYSMVIDSDKGIVQRKISIVR